MVPSVLLSLAGPTLLGFLAGSPADGGASVDALRRLEAGESSQAIAKPENSEERPGLDILICALLLELWRP